EQAMKLERLRRLSQMREELEEIECQLRQMPADLARQLAQAERGLAELTELRVALPWLATLAEERAACRRAAEEERALAAAEAGLLQSATEAEESLHHAEAALAQAEGRAREARDALT